MSEPIWLSEAAIVALHEELIVEHGGLGGVCNPGLLASALARPQNLLAYGEPNLFELAAAYAFGLVRNHPFIDGDKRAGLMTAYVFLRLNGYRLIASEAEAVAVIRDLAASEIEEAELGRWIEANVEAL